MSQTLALIQNKIDSSKESIGDGEYLELCNLMKHNNKHAYAGIPVIV